MMFYNPWQATDELTFHQKAIILEACAKSQIGGPENITHSPPSHETGLPWVMDFLDDFAHVASGSGGAPNVAAACLEQLQSPENRLVVRVAKNENFKPAEMDRLSQVVLTMNQVRTSELSVSEAQQICFDIIASGCESRMMKHITGPKGLSYLLDQCVIKESNFSASIQTSSVLEEQTVHEQQVEDSPEAAIKSWEEMKRLLQILRSSRETTALKKLARLSYDIRHSVCFRNLLGDECRRDYQALQIVEKLGKLAKFYRSAVNLIRIADSDWVRSKPITLEVVPSSTQKIEALRGCSLSHTERNYPSLKRKQSRQRDEIRRLLRRWQKYVIHAEILLLIFYEEHLDINLVTTYIGISKRSCYLCSNFIRLHGRFNVEGQHHQLYCLWTLPRQIELTLPEQRANFAKALLELHDIITQNVEEALRPSYRPLQSLKESVANFSRVSVIPQTQRMNNLELIIEDQVLEPGLSFEDSNNNFQTVSDVRPTETSSSQSVEQAQTTVDLDARAPNEIDEEILRVVEPAIFNSIGTKKSLKKQVKENRIRAVKSQRKHKGNQSTKERQESTTSKAHSSRSSRRNRSSGENYTKAKSSSSQKKKQVSRRRRQKSIGFRFSNVIRSVAKAIKRFMFSNQQRRK